MAKAELDVLDRGERDQPKRRCLGAMPTAHR